MLTRRDLFRAGGAAAMTAGLAACGGGDSSKDLSFMYWGSSYEDKAIRAMLKSFTAAKHVGTKPIYVTGDYNTKVNTLVAGHSTPDVAYMPAGIGYRLAQQGKLVDIYPYFKKYPQLAEDLSQTYFWYDRNKCFGTQTADEIILIWYSTKALKTAGITPPAEAGKAWTWDEFVQAATKLTLDQNGKHPSDSGFDPKNIKQFGVQVDITYRGIWYPLLLSKGGDVVDKTGTKYQLDSPEAITVFQNLQDLIYKHHVAPTPSQLGNNAPPTQVQLATGRMAMVIDGQWSLLDIAQSNVDFDAAVLPRYDKPYTLSLGGASVIFTASKHPKQALELFLYHNDPKYVNLYKSGLWMPLAKKYYTDPATIASWTKNKAHPPSFKTAVIDYTLNNSVTDFYQRLKNIDNIDEVLTPALQQISTGKKSAKEVLTALKSKVQPLLQGWFPTQQP